MKKYFALIVVLLLALTGFGQDAAAEPAAVAWYGTTEFWVVLGSAALLVIEWILNAIPTTKPVGFILKAAVSLLKWLINRVPDKRKIK